MMDLFSSEAFCGVASNGMLEKNNFLSTVPSAKSGYTTCPVIV